MLHSDDLPHLRVGTQWTYCDILTDPEVVYSPRGYSVAVRVDRGGIHHILYVSARSLGTPLETLRQKRGTLTGAQLRIRRESPEKLAPYQVEECT